MPKLRKSALIAWLICVVTIFAAFAHAASIVFQNTGQEDLYANIIFALVPILFAIPAALIISRHPGNTIGWLLMINPLVEIPSSLFSIYLSGFQTAPPSPTFLNLFMVGLVSLSWMALIFPVLLIPLFFPTGRLISPRWRWPVYLTIGMTLFLGIWGVFTRRIYLDFLPWEMTNPIGFLSDETTSAILAPWSMLLAGVTLASLASVVVRYRRGSLVERQQMKWLLYACFLFGLIYIPGIFSNTNTNQWSVNQLIGYLLPFAIVAIPASITIAILRYRLFDIDVIIRLTLVYGLLTGLLGLVYFDGVVLLQQIFRTLSGQTGQVAIVITTLLMAALFNPLRRRIQSVIDRRFFRQKYNADQALARFAVAARDSTVPADLTTMLLDITRETLEPTQVSLFLVKKP